MGTFRNARQLAIYVSVALVAAGGVSSALADGVAFKGLDWGSLTPALENEQIAAINHRNGVQRMIIGINFDATDDEQALWLFPVPGRPEAVSVDIQDTFPRFLGRDPAAIARTTIWKTMTCVRAWQLYPLLVEGLGLLPHLGRGGDVGVHDRIEKWGIRAEVLTADSPAALHEYLTSQGAVLAGGQLVTVEPYLDGQHVLVVAWISSPRKVREAFPDIERHAAAAGRRPCLYTEFATERAYFPLKPTSAYGDAIVPFRLWVTGFVEPQTQAVAVSDGVSVDYFRGGGFDKPELEQWARGLPTDATPYTRITGELSARLFTDDLWFVPTNPRHIRYADAIRDMGQSGLRIPLLLLLAAVLSFVSGGFAGLLTVRRWRRPAMLGLWNMVTLYGLYIALRDRDLAGGTNGGTSRKLRSEYCIAFSAVYVILSVILQLALLAPLRL